MHSPVDHKQEQAMHISHKDEEVDLVLFAQQGRSGMDTHVCFKKERTKVNLKRTGIMVKLFLKNDLWPKWLKIHEPLTT